MIKWCSPIKWLWHFNLHLHKHKCCCIIFNNIHLGCHIAIQFPNGTKVLLKTKNSNFSFSAPLSRVHCLFSCQLLMVSDVRKWLERGRYKFSQYLLLCRRCWRVERNDPVMFERASEQKIKIPRSFCKTTVEAYISSLSEFFETHTRVGGYLRCMYFENRERKLVKTNLFVGQLLKYFFLFLSITYQNKKY